MWEAKDPQRVQLAGVSWSKVRRCMIGRYAWRGRASKDGDVRQCSHNHRFPIPARKCGESLARKLNREVA